MSINIFVFIILLLKDHIPHSWQLYRLGLLQGRNYYYLLQIPKTQQICLNQIVSISFHNIWLLLPHNSAHLLIYIDGYSFLSFLFRLPWSIFWAKVFNSVCVLVKYCQSYYKDMLYVNWYFLCLSQAGSLACSCVLASMNSACLDITFNPPLINLNFWSCFRSTMSWECLSLVSLNGKKWYYTYIC